MVHHKMAVIGNGTAGAAPAPAASAIDFGAIDAALQSLPKGNIAFNAPERMILQEQSAIYLALSPQESIQSLQQSLQKQLSGQQSLQGATIQIAPEMQARLTGQDFSITAVTPETQAVSGVQETQWRWDVTPLKAGTDQLHLTLSAIINVNGSSMPRSIQTFDREIPVRVTWNQRISGFFANRWDWLLSAI
ncbi:MAG: hypothetical protein KGM47_12600, partial [Acidobacteriota bacterium]|nr:hypothetical protein [Acidobacteriota bacterium]